MAIRKLSDIVNDSMRYVLHSRPHCTTCNEPLDHRGQCYRCEHFWWIHERARCDNDYGCPALCIPLNSVEHWGCDCDECYAEARRIQWVHGLRTGDAVDVVHRWAGDGTLHQPGVVTDFSPAFGHGGSMLAIMTSTPGHDVLEWYHRNNGVAIGASGVLREPKIQRQCPEVPELRVQAESPG